MKHLKLHAKMMLADGKRAIVGSINLAPGSFDGRRELAIETDDPGTVLRLQETAQRDWDSSHKIDLSDAGLLRDLRSASSTRATWSLTAAPPRHRSRKEAQAQGCGRRLTCPCPGAPALPWACCCSAWPGSGRCRRTRPMTPAAPNTRFAGTPRRAVRASAAEVMKALRLERGKRKSYEVRFFSVQQPAGLEEGSAAIVRQRSAKDSVETMYKLRATTPFPRRRPAGRLAVPLSGQRRRQPQGRGRRGLERRRLEPRLRTYSLSCEADGTADMLLPAPYKATPLACSSQVRRTQAADFKIERWTLPGGAVAIEVSWEAGDNPADLESFRRQVVQPLLAQGARAQASSKTELGSGC